MKFFNFHTHNKSEKFGIINLFPEEFPEDTDKIYSIGLHPWYYSENDYLGKIREINAKISQKNIIAIGETGLDPNSPVNIKVQEDIFIEHINLSEVYKKPLIIHCVKFYNELIFLKKKLQPQQAWIIHGFTGKVGLIKELIEHNIYFSISETILRTPEKIDKFLALIPLNRLFLETDDKNYNIKNIYDIIASKLNLSSKELVDIINSNLKDIGI
ncbi:MAG: TatD family hydrolase [Bacteroidales bacterium]|jgi:TatD DNase family protein|nr:TatD family hydrolase [Bacteroidales bacterium]